MSDLKLNYEVDGGDLVQAGEASSKMKMTLKKLGLPPEVIRRASICMYEGEINMVIHAHGGKITVTVDDDAVTMVLADVGPGIPDVEKARQPMFTTGGEERSGMGFTIMESFMDSLKVRSVAGRGTTVVMKKKIAPRIKR